MGDIEQRGKKRARRRNVKGIILQTVAAAGIVGLAIAAPNALAAFHKFGLIPTPYDKGVMVRTRRRMLEQGLLANQGQFVRLTDRGKRALLLLTAKDAIHKNRRWDGRWRILTFDVPEYRRNLRDKIRRTLNSIGFVRLQDSVWVYPYDCEDFVTLLKADFKIGKDVLYMIVDELEYDERLRKEFGLQTRR